jgi:large subunit ribosomal protein L25
MKQEFNLVAELREDQGKGASRRLRREGKVPAILYGGGRPPRNLAFDQNKVLQQLDHEAFYSSILTITVGDKSQPAILKDLQRHPAKRQIIHMDMQRIREDEKIRVHVPLHFLGEEIAPGVKQGGGSVSRLMTDVEVSCLPKDLPEYLEVDISHLDLDDMLYLSDIKTPEGVELTELAHGEGHDHAIVSIHVHKAAPIEEEAVAEAEEAVEGAEAEPAKPEEGED